MIPLILASLTLLADEGEEYYRKRVYSHLMISDAASAVAEAESALKRFPASKPLQMAYLQTLCERGEEMAAMRLWSDMGVKEGRDPLSRKMLEILAWGVLKKGEASLQLNVRLHALIGGAMTRDAQAIPLIVSQLRSSNALLRSVAVRIASSYGDAPLKEEIARLLVEEKVWYVRLAVIEAAGKMRLYALKSQLKEIIADSKVLIEERATALLALVGMYDAIGAEELQGLVVSDRAGLRQLASELICHLELTNQLPMLLPLLQDSSPDVRISVLNTLVLLNVKQVGALPVQALILPQLHNPSPAVAITAAYALLVHGEEVGEEALSSWIESEEGQWRRLSSSALSISGKRGLRLSLKQFFKTQDPYVKVNLAKGLIGQRVQVKMASEAIHAALSQEKETLWMWQQGENPLFRSLSPSRVRHIEGIPHYPAVVDQMVRLDLLSVLSIAGYSQAQCAVREFLQAKSWGVTGTAAATLLQEGDEEGLEAVRALLTDSDEMIRCQAALILATLGSDPSAVPVLQELYSRVDRERKVHILEALAHVGDPRSVPFLVELLEEPFQILRVVAASALIQCLYH